MREQIVFYYRFVRDYFLGLFRDKRKLYRYSKAKIHHYFNNLPTEFYVVAHTAAKDEPLYRPFFKSGLLQNEFTRPYLNVVDLGCGYSDFYRQLSKYHNTKYFGVDFSLNTLQVAKSKYGGNYIVADIEHIPFVKGVFDVAICINVFPYIQNLDAAAQAFSHIIKYKGYMAVIVPVKNRYWEINFDGISLEIHDVEHIIQVFSKRKLKLIEKEPIRFFFMPHITFSTVYGFYLLFIKEE